MGPRDIQKKLDGSQPSGACEVSATCRKVRKLSSHPCPLTLAVLAPHHILGRYGHTMLLRTADASLYLFGGLDGRGQFLNDLWKFKLDPGDYECDWHELFPAQSMAGQYSSRDTNPLTPRRRGQVPLPLPSLYCCNNLRRCQDSPAAAPATLPPCPT